ncbi:hypothetical protein EIH07_02375 [Chryseobacterium taklimakanense]|uniref:hypothetical protein n=1 Tax=Chryseobacterium taklimakanense TaxID=536441 RepID=UPI000F6024B8|nr:hypothetical protein [Chryseobacterium taklimakanense]AZI21964.1 hypothetical protein EIH07_02375 [Chryseobacterium taklimakanense]
MADLDLLHFEQLKSEIQTKYLTNHTPSNEDISDWKGIDIIYFQEDLRKIAKGNISEKSFYTYFKSTPATKLPRIDILNLLSVYAGYASWYDFKKNHLFADEILREQESGEEIQTAETESDPGNAQNLASDGKTAGNEAEESQLEAVLQKSSSENQELIKNEDFSNFSQSKAEPRVKKFVKKNLWYGISGILALLVGFLGLKDQFISKEYYYTFIDADRNSKINGDLQVKIFKENESPILYTAKPNEPFVYKNPRSKTLVMEVSSPYYKTDRIVRNLETAPESETIELKPNDYAIMLYYYSNSKQDIKRKRERLNYLISDNALIYQVYDNDKYGVETLDKRRYITLVTTPTTSLKNMEVIDTQMEKGKIVLIKFKIISNETS